MTEYRHHGIGFVFTKDDNFTGLDLDKCRDPETGELSPLIEWNQWKAIMRGVCVDDFTFAPLKEIHRLKKSALGVIAI